MKFFTGPVAIVLEADMLHVSILFLTNHARVYAETRFGGTKKYSTYVYLRTIFGAQSERYEWSLFFSHDSYQVFSLIYHAAARAP